MRNPLVSLWLPTGRLRRRSYLFATLLIVIAGVGLWVALETWIGRGATWFVHLPLLWLLFALASRRLHDRDHSGLRLLWLLIPLLGPLWIAFELLFLRGTRGANRYGPDPRQRRSGYLPISGLPQIYL